MSAHGPQHEPQPGDIWEFKGSNIQSVARYYLILKRDPQYKVYHFFCLGEGVYDSANIYHFDRYCEKAI